MTRLNLEGLINRSQVEAIRTELNRRKEVLVRLSYQASVQMDDLDRRNIQYFFENGCHPGRPQTVSLVLKKFIKSSYSYAPLRNFLRSKIGGIPSTDTIQKCLFLVFDAPDFLDESTWTPEGIEKLAKTIQCRLNLDLSSNRFKERMMAVLLSGPKILGFELEDGLESFYTKVDRISNDGAEAMWSYVHEFSRSMNKVGPALACDFLKGIGFVRFVKIDHHFKREFPALVGIDGCRSLSEKENFVLSQLLADALAMTPYHLDHLLYQWGRHKKYQQRIQ